MGPGGLVVSATSFCTAIHTRRGFRSKSRGRGGVADADRLTIVEYVTSLIDLVGNTPLRAADPGHRGRQAAGAGQGGVPEPGWLGEGPDRGQDDRGGRAGRAAEAGRHHRRAHQRQHRRRAGHRGPGARATTASSSAPTRSARTSGTCWPRTAPGSWSARPRSSRTTRTPTTRSPTGWSARSRAPGSRTSTPTRTTRPATTSRPARRSGARPREGSPTSSPASAPAARSAAPAAISRRCRRARVQVVGADPCRLGLLRRQRPALPGRGGRRGLLAGQLRPRESATRSSRSPTPTRSP